MNYTMTPAEIERYRRTKITVYGMSQRYCAGCKRRRSVAQFDDGQQHCRRCVMRGSK